ncbi:MAG TPA: hypothetical protein VFY65_17175 [Longimicrobium sp.]|nr:hypothetical protein [Longimicrobium sp.]
MTWSLVRRRAGTVLEVALGGAALLAMYWALGGTRGLPAVGGGNAFHPPAGLMWTTAFLLAGWMLIVSGAAGKWGGETVNGFCRFACCVIAIALLGVAGACFGSETSWERMIAGPLMLLLAAGAAVLVRAEPRQPGLSPW